MSVKITSQVWEWSESERNARLVLLALADFCDDDGFCFPGIARIAKKCRLTDRTVQRAIAELKELGELEVDENEGAKTKTGHTNRYRVTLQSKRCKTVTPDIQGVTNQASRGDNSGSEGVSVVSPKPSVEPSVEPPSDKLTLEAEAANSFSKKAAEIRDFRIIWNTLPKPFPRIEVMSDGRVKKLAARLKDDGWRARWREALQLMPDLPFLRGENDRKWIADVDFFLRPDSVAKILEGKYGKPQATPAQPAKTTDDPTWFRRYL